MKYYAVTENPDELMHWGVLGMKWGVRKERPRHTGARRRSTAYRKAQSKLGKMMKSGIKKAEANWKAYNSPEAKYARQTDRAIQRARKGKLKYGKLTDDQVRRVTERLELERQARALSNTEQRFTSRLSRSITEGVIKGVGEGFGKRASEFIGRKSVLKTDRLRAEQQDRLDQAKERRKIRNAEREANKKIEREFKDDARRDEYEHERDLKYEREKARNAYLYGAKYDDSGKLIGDSYSTYYDNRYSKKQTVQNQAKIAEKRDAKERERQARLENTVREREAAKAAAARRADEERKRMEADIKERERYRRGIEQLSKEASKRDADRAWDSRSSRMAARQSSAVRIVEPSYTKLPGSTRRKRHGK